MKISESWLRSFVDPAVDTDELSGQLTMAGLEVDGIEKPGEGLESIVVGRVVEATPHPNADRLTLCQVDSGESEHLQIVCGAPNVSIGTCYPLARVGTRLPGGLKIRKSKIRGELSYGMLCSAVELQLGGEADGILALEGNHEPGTSLIDALGLGGTVIDIDLTPNRADCFSVVGVAREVAAANGMVFEPPTPAAVDVVTDEVCTVQVTEPDHCPRFAGRVLSNVDNTAVTPAWMRQRLEMSGVRSINPVVDVTNYVMLETGCPMHAYDLAKIDGDIDVRFGRDRENLVLLDDQKIEVGEDVLVIADDSGPVSLAGIMGGARTAVLDSATEIFLECAFWSPAIIAGKARRFGLHTDASMRFERGVDPQGQVGAIERTTALIQEIAGGDSGPVQEVVNEPGLPVNEEVLLRRDRLDALLGVHVENDDVVDMFKRLGFAVSATADGWAVTAHSARFDIEIEADLVEEIARIFGYDNLPVVPANDFVPLGQATEHSVDSARIADLLVDRGYREIITYSFIDEASDRDYATGGAGLALTNPISSDLSVMRQSLWPGLVSTYMSNAARQRSRMQIFECGALFDNSRGEVLERQVLSGLAAGTSLPEQWGIQESAVDYFDIKSDLEAIFDLTGQRAEFSFNSGEHPALHPGRTARITRNDAAVGWLGEIHPALARRVGVEVPLVLFELELNPLISAALPHFSDVSRYPAVRRDLALVVRKEVPAGDLLAEARSAAGSALQDIVVFDVYMGKNIDSGLKSVALGLILQETSRTLTDTDAEEIIRAVAEHLAEKFGAKIRE